MGMAWTFKCSWKNIVPKTTWPQSSKSKERLEDGKQAQENQVKEIEQKTEQTLAHMENPQVANALPSSRYVESKDKDEMHKTFKDLFKKLEFTSWSRRRLDTGGTRR